MFGQQTTSPMNVTCSQFSFYYYFTRAASGQGMQDESGAKSGNWLAEFVYVVSTSFTILFS